MYHKLLVALVLGLALAACGPAQDCITTDGGTQICVSVNPAGSTELPSTPPVETTAAPAATATDSETITCTDGMAMLQIPEGKTITVFAGCRISGDVVVDDHTVYDNEGSTGAVVDVQDTVKVFAQWGASVNADSVDVWVANMRSSGCTGNCTKVAHWECNGGCKLVDWK